MAPYPMIAEILAAVSPLCERRPLLLGVGFEGHCEGIRVARGDIVLIQHASGGDVGGEGRIDLGAAFSQLRHRVDECGTVPLPDEKGFEGLLRRLLGHETGVREIAALLVATGDSQVMLRLAQPGQCPHDPAS